MFDEIITKLSRVVSRSGALARVSSACSAFVLAIAGPKRGAMGYTAIGCCDLRSKVHCEGDDPASWNCVSTWCWTCGTFRVRDCTIFRCYECYSYDRLNATLNTNSEGRHMVSDDPASNIVCSKAVNTKIPCWDQNQRAKTPTVSQRGYLPRL